MRPALCWSLLLFLIVPSACADKGTEPDLGPAKVVIESASATGSSIQIIEVAVRNIGGEGAFYLEFGAYSNVPNQPGPTNRTESVTVLPGYREALRYSVSGGTVARLRVYSRPHNTAVYSRTDCYDLNDNRHC